MSRNVLLGALLGLAVCAAAAQGQVVIENFDSDPVSSANGSVLFGTPTRSGSTYQFVDPAVPNVSQVTAAQSASSPNSLKVSWKWLDASTANWLRLTTYNTTTRPNPAIDYSQKLRFKVLYPAGDPLGMAIGARETGTTAAIGADGGTSGTIEWIGSTATVDVHPVPVKTLTASPNWQIVEFDIPNLPVSAFTGNGVLDGSRGTLECIAFVRTGSAGPVTLYIDDVEQSTPANALGIPDSEYNALVAIYRSTGGPAWTHNDNWLTSNPNWYGVTITNGHVTRLSLQDNNITGTLPAAIGDLPCLVELWMYNNSNNHLTGPIPPEIGNLRSVQVINLFNNKLTGNIPAEMGNLTELRWLSLHYNQLTGEIPAQLGSLTKLQGLWLGGNHLANPGVPAWIQGLTDLHTLCLEGTSLGGGIPSWMGSLSNLQELRLSNCSLTGTIPAELAKLTNLQWLWLCCNQFTGDVPLWLGGLTSLRGLGLNSNQLTGHIPAQLGSLIALETLDLGANQLTGTIPAELGKLTNLQWLWLCCNQFTGDVPSWLGGLTNLRGLGLNDNQLTGSLPAAFGQLARLENLQLQSNAITGVVPETVTGMTALNNLNIGHNGLVATDSSVSSFLGSKQADWSNTQTISPAGVTVSGVSGSSVTLSWQPIKYTGDQGYYEVGFSTTAGGPYTFLPANRTASKSATSLTIGGLAAGSTYYFVVRTVTSAGAWDKVAVVSSPLSSELTVQTGPAGAFDDIGANLTAEGDGDAAWGDFDNDGDLDLVVTGDETGNMTQLSTRIYRNDNGVFTDIGAGLPGLENGRAAWGDYDADGDLDLALCGCTSWEYPGVYTTRIYRNDSGRFTDIGASLPGVRNGALAWADYDNDGHLDLFLAGDTNMQTQVFMARVYRYDNGTFVEANTDFTGSQACAAAWGDYDKDGDLDLLLAGKMFGWNPYAVLYRNDGGRFTADLDTGLSTGYAKKIAWGDYDNDGDLDLALGGYPCKVYRNDGGKFTDIQAGLPSVGMGSILWGDVDNDGDLDLLIGGSGTGGVKGTCIYRNDNGNFVRAWEYEDVSFAAAAFGDYDADGDLDFVLSGELSDGTPVTKVFRNGLAAQNTAPSAPSALQTMVNGGLVSFKWSAASDDHTPAAGLCYNMRIGTAPGAGDVYSGMALSSGRRLLPDLGSAQDKLSWTLKNPPVGTYYWSVQAIDSSFTASEWSAEQSVQVAPYITVLAPDGGENYYYEGDSQTIKWAFSGFSGDVEICYSTDGGASCPKVIGRVPASDGVFTWTVPDENSDHCRVRISQVGGDVSGVSGSDFSIHPATITVTSPGNGDVWNATGSCTVTWTPVGLGTGRVRVMLSMDGGASYPVNLGEAYGPSGQLIVNLPDMVSTNARIRVEAVDGAPSGESSGTFQIVRGPFTARNGQGVPSLYNMWAAWGDYDGDGDLDLAVCGRGYGSTGNTYESHIYRNDGGKFTDINAGIAGAAYGSLAWGDYDGDGDLDLAVSGYRYDTASHYESHIYRNDGGKFTDINAGITGLAYGNVGWGDYDNDGDLDLAVCGSWYDSSTGDWVPESRIYRNDGGKFTDINAGIAGVDNSCLAWGDYDNDGDLDLAVCGYRSGVGQAASIYRNDDGTFTDINAGIAGLSSGNVAWGDYDNDGDLDLAICGERHDSSTGGWVPESHIYRNDGGAFTDINAGVPGVSNGSLAWGDYDGDGKLDLLLTGTTSGSSSITVVLTNNAARANARPAAPAGLTSVVSGSNVTFSWNAASDAETPAAGLSYNLRVGTTPGASDVFAGMADPSSGLRRLPALGNAQKRLSWTLGNLTPGVHPYYWSVQAIDTAFAGSFWPEETIAGRIPSLKEGADQAPVACPPMVVTAVYSSACYVEATDRSWGIRVNGPTSGLALGQMVSVTGTLSTDTSGERCIKTTTVPTPAGTFGLSPLAVRCGDVGGAGWFYNATTGAGQKGVAGCSAGLNNIGLLVSVTGKLQYIYSGNRMFTVWDGSLRGGQPLVDALGHPGLMVSSPVVLPTGLQQGDCVTITGVVGCISSTTGMYPVIRVRTADDIVPVK